MSLEDKINQNIKDAMRAKEKEKLETLRAIKAAIIIEKTQKEAEASVIEKYLPEQMSNEELTKKIEDIIAKTGAKSMADMGKVMGAASKELAGKAEGKAIADKVKALLSL